VNGFLLDTNIPSGLIRTLVTRNVGDFAALGVEVINPWGCLNP
jgi:hypothetical protein